jgi:streptogramin lyase
MRARTEGEVTAVVRAHRLDEMKYGAVFEKHGRRGSPGLRYVRLSPDMRTIEYFPVPRGGLPYVRWIRTQNTGKHNVCFKIF